MNSFKWALSIALLGALILTACQPVMPVEESPVARAFEEAPTATPYPELPGEVFIPAGEFQMGCDEENPADNCREVELPLHTVYLDDYYIDKFEVSNARYQACVESGVCERPTELYSRTREDYYGVPEFDDYPVVFVNWGMAQAFCEWEGKRLPTEAEWMKAARGPDDTRKYPWGNETPTCELSNHWAGSDGCLGDSMPVDSLPDGASPYGVHHMAGNVAEWVSDYYEDEYYSVSPLENPKGPETGSARTIMDGTFADTPTYSDVTVRTSFSPNVQYRWLGFRCAHSP